MAACIVEFSSETVDRWASMAAWRARGRTVSWQCGVPCPIFFLLPPNEVSMRSPLNKTAVSA